MNTFATAIFLALLSTHVLAATPQETLASFHSALAAGDKIKATELLSPEITIFESGFVERSRAEYASHHLPGDISFAKSSTRKVLRQTERIEGKLAILWEETETTGNFQGKDIHSFGTETVLLEKKGDQWTIVHVHWSSRKAK